MAITITDGHCCEAETEVFVKENETSLSASVESVVGQCGSCEITLKLSGGVGPYTVNLSTGEYVLVPAGANEVKIRSSLICNKSIRVNMVDANGCTFDVDVDVPDSKSPYSAQVTYGRIVSLHPCRQRIMIELIDSDGNLGRVESISAAKIGPFGNTESTSSSATNFIDLDDGRWRIDIIDGFGCPHTLYVEVDCKPIINFDPIDDIFNNDPPEFERRRNQVAPGI